MDYTGECDVSIHPTAEEKQMIRRITQSGETSRGEQRADSTSGVKRKNVEVIRDDGGLVKRQKTRRRGGKLPKSLPRIRGDRRENKVRKKNNAKGRDLRRKLRKKDVGGLPMRGEVDIIK